MATSVPWVHQCLLVWMHDVSMPIFRVVLLLDADALWDIVYYYWRACKVCAVYQVLAVVTT